MKTTVFPLIDLLPTRQNYINNYIAGLDPLDADETLKSLPLLNKQRDIKGLIKMLSGLLPSLREIFNFDYYQSAAAMRDIGMVLGSIKRHGIEPELTVPELSLKLKYLAEKTGLPPRDTILHYTVWNPAGSRERTYTDSPEEKKIIEEVTLAMAPLSHAINDLKKIYYISTDTKEFGTLCDGVMRNLNRLKDALNKAIGTVSSSFYTSELKFYFNSIFIENVAYSGPIITEMPIFILDHIFWSADYQDHEKYIQFKKTTLPYLLPELREVYEEFAGFKSLIQKISNEIEAAKGKTQEIVFHSLSKLHALGNLLVQLRSPYERIAEASCSTYQKGTPQEEFSPIWTSGVANIMREKLQKLKLLENNMTIAIRYAAAS